MENVNFESLEKLKEYYEISVVSKYLKNDLKELGYILYDDLLCATDYEIPQTRTRYFLIAKLDSKSFKFPNKIKSNVKLYKFLEDNVDESYYLTEKNILR